MHYYKFNISNWQSATRHLTPEEEGVYIRLINHYYDSEKPIPLETHSVIRRLMLGSHSETVQLILNEFFVKTDRGYEKEKCNELIKEYKKTANKNKKNGLLGGRPKKVAAQKETQSVSSGMPNGTQKEPKHNPNQEPLTKNQELETINQEPNKNNDDIALIINHLNLKAGTKFQSSAGKTKTIINARLKIYSVEDCISVIDKKSAEWNGTEWAKYLRPSTLFNETKFEGYLNQPVVNTEYSSITQQNINALSGLELD